MTAVLAETAGPAVATTMAGLRGTYWDEARLPADVRVTVHPLRTADGATVTGYLFRHGGERAVVCAMHPRELVVPQYLIPDLLHRGVAVWVMGARSPGNDLRLEHETALLDLAAGQVFLRDRMGFARRILQGTSGGGPLAAFYCQQAARPPEARLGRSPAGRPTGLDAADMPLPDGVILLSSHLGQGRLLLNGIDPAVTDEADPLLTDESLSAFSLANGFRPPPHSATYAPDFITLYRTAQRSRVERIDAVARALIARKQEARRRLKVSPDRDDAVLAAYAPIFQVWRTDADPRCFDLSLDPSDRAYGSLWGGNPIVSNFGSVGFGRICTPESWLSNWSALSSNAGMEQVAPDLTVPTLMIEYTGDNSVFPTEAEMLFSWIGAADKQRHRIPGNHHGLAVRPGAPSGRLEAAARIGDWLEEKGFIHG